MRRIAVLSCVALLFVAGAVLAASAPEEKAKAAAAKPQPPSKLDIIKKLAGDWVEVGEDGKPTGKVLSTYRVTAGGSAVQETLFGGTPHEMITLYYLDGDDLALTHYCVAGNQPRMKAEKQNDPNKLVFNCAGGVKSENDEHMHHATIVFKDENHIQSEWLEYKDGKQIMNASLNLARK
jgi:hypothetical protein